MKLQYISFILCELREKHFLSTINDNFPVDATSKCSLFMQGLVISTGKIGFVINSTKYTVDFQKKSLD